MNRRGKVEMYDVVCLGNICADAIGRPIDSIGEKGKIIRVEQLELHTGGCATNSAIDLAKIGVKVAIAGKIGNDGFGSFIFNSLEAEGVNVEGLKREDGISTSASMILVGSDGERTILHSFGSNAVFTKEDIDLSFISKAKILFVAGSLLMPRFDGEPTARILKKAQGMGVYTVLDTAWDSTGRWMKAIGPCLPYLDLFIPSEDEARMLSNKEDPKDMADVFLSMGAKSVVIKLGKKGCLIRNAQESIAVPAFKVDAVDATGAGDSFVAGFITGLLKGWDLEQCGIFANAVGAHCVMDMGASKGIKSFDEIMKFIQEYNNEDGKEV